MKIVIASRNAGKIEEIEKYLAEPRIRLIPLSEFPDIPELCETESSFEKNAVSKARVVAEATGILTLSDDSGLEVDALGGAPGVRSARFAGEHTSDQENNVKLLERMRDVPDAERTARFRCVIALCEPGAAVELADGTCEGLILREPRGEKGFGYDPLFYYPPLKLTFSEMDAATKLSVSHRGNALRRLKSILAPRLEADADNG